MQFKHAKPIMKYFSIILFGSFTKWLQRCNPNILWILMSSWSSCQIFSLTGRSHGLMSLEELSELVKDSVEPLKQKAEQRLDELSVLMRETTQTLNHWDTETNETVKLIHNTRDEHVRALLLCQWLCFPLSCFFSIQVFSHWRNNSVSILKGIFCPIQD